METQPSPGFIHRLAQELRPSGSLAAPRGARTILWIAVIWTWGSAFNTFLIAGIFFVLALGRAARWGWV